MIELVPAEHDDLAFLSLAQRVMNGAISTLQTHEVYLVHIDNWFDYKWLGFWSHWEHREPKDLYVPPFNPNRVRSQKHFVCEGNGPWRHTGEGNRLHLCQPGRGSSYGQLLDEVSKSAAFVWYSGNTITNSAGSMMVYLSGAEGYAWYASFKKDKHWIIAKEFQITRRVLQSYEERGRQMELARE